MGGESILFIDDEPSLEKMAQRILESLGYRVTTCSNSKQALTQFRKAPHDFDMVITDMTMPRMTGDQLTRELLKIRPNVPVMIYTGFNENISPEKALASGAKALLIKPLQRYELAKIVRQLLDGRASGYPHKSK